MQTFERPLVDQSRSTSLSEWWRTGAPWIWLNASAVSVSMILVIGLVLMICGRGLSHFWPADVIEFRYADPSGEINVLGEVSSIEQIPMQQFMDSTGGIGIDRLAPGQQTVEAWLVKVGNREQDARDFRWYYRHLIEPPVKPADAVVLERTEWGNAYGRLVDLKERGRSLGMSWDELSARLERAASLRERIQSLRKDDVGDINYRLEQLRLERVHIDREASIGADERAARLQPIEAEEQSLKQRYKSIEQEIDALGGEIGRDSLVLERMDSSRTEIPLANVIRAWRPNQMSLLDKIGSYLHSFKGFIVEEPREANTEGGIFPAIFGTVLMVLIMSLLVTPFGVVAAIYLREYARQGLMVQTIRIAVNNLAGVPSIVYGVFGLGFFVYLIGGTIDQIFYPDRLPAPTFGTPGLLWASLTLALLTVPVVIVSTEEGLARIPRATREGSLALGATKAETLWRVILPMASPAIMTGVILAVARAAGEVAPLMLVGVVKLAPQLPVDGHPPFIHLERKFMHLGFHIYDVGFQSPNVEAARPVVYATAFLLVVVIVVLNLSAILLRNRLTRRYSGNQ